MIVFTNTLSNRLQYIVETLFAYVDEEVLITNNVSDYLSYDGVKINYSNSELDKNEICILSHTLLFENKIQHQSIEVKWVNQVPIFFCNEGSIKFDLFAASFYLLSRYEEYLPHPKDEYQRFAHTASLAFQHQFLHLPIINLWLKNFQEQLQKKWPSFQLLPKSFKYIPTFDVDIAYHLKGKKWWKQLAHLMQPLIRAKWSNFNLAFQQFSGKQSDELDLFDELLTLCKANELASIWFLLAAEKSSKYDKNINPHSKAFYQLAQKLVQKATVGIHPSWQSNFNSRLLYQEKRLVETAIKQKVIQSRHHYIYTTLPKSYRSLIDAGIQEDYSMGYGSINGFRASYCLPFFWYDLMNESTSTLQLFPFAFMDANAIFEEKLTAEQTAQQLMHFYNIVKEVNGVLITIHHNHFLSNRYNAYKVVFENFIQLF